MKRSTAILGAVAVWLAIPWQVQAIQDQTIQFSDDALHWANWGNGSADDTKDTLGTPDVTGGEAVIQDGKIESVSIFLDRTTTATWEETLWNTMLIPGDLFIDLDHNAANPNWDWVVTSTGGIYDFTSSPIALSDPSAYDITGPDNTGYWSGYLIRDGHPWRLSSDYLSNPAVIPVGTATESPTDWPTLPSSDTTFALVFAGLNIPVLSSDNPIVFGWTMNCANDVLFGGATFSNEAPVPEPGTLLMLGAGLTALFGASRRRRLLG